MSIAIQMESPSDCSQANAIIGGSIIAAPPKQSLPNAMTTKPSPEDEAQSLTDSIKATDTYDGKPTGNDTPSVVPEIPIIDENGQPLSKNKLKRLRRDRQWEENRDKRKAKRKEKDAEKKARRRAERAAAVSRTSPLASEINGRVEDGGQREDGGISRPAKRPRLSNLEHPDSSHQLNGSPIVNTKPHVQGSTTVISPTLSSRHHRPCAEHTPLPIRIILDCSYDNLMTLPEIKSLSTQITRSYSDCYRARYQPGGGLVISSFSGQLKERFDTVLAGNYKGWKRGKVTFTETAFAEVARESRTERGSVVGKTEGAFAKFADRTHDLSPKNNQTSDITEDADTNEDGEGEIVYLTSDSPETLSHLSPNGTYIIGGLVDKNRHKGICYKRAIAAGIRTAKLPIGDFMQMNSRFVLATNHVVELLLRWLEGKGWGAAFEKVVPKRKGGKLKEMSEGVANGDLGGEEMEAGEVEGEELDIDDARPGDDTNENIEVEVGVQAGRVKGDNREGA